MPIYEYVCAACGDEFEALQKFSDKPLTKCTCGKAGAVQRKLSLSAFQLKGGGWYKDHYGAAKSAGNGKSDGAKADSNGEGAKSDATGKSDGAKVESKAEAKSESKAEGKGSAKSDSGSSTSSSGTSAKGGGAGAST